MRALPASVGVHGVLEVLVLVVVDPLLALPLLGLYPVSSCTHTHTPIMHYTNSDCYWWKICD